MCGSEAVSYTHLDVYKRQILEGKHDDIPEQMFLFAGSIDEVVEKYENSKK